MSAPAWTVCTTASSGSYARRIACILNESVRITPPNPIVPRSRSPRMTGDSVAGCSGSRAGNMMCDVMTMSTPQSTAARKGTSSRRPSAWRSPSTRARPRCVSMLLSPCPGKCLAAAMIPASWRPATAARTCRATASGSSPNDRMPMMEFSGLLFTSAAGARSAFRPAARSSSPKTVYISRVSSTAPVAPSPMLPGPGQLCRVSTAHAPS